METKEYRTTDKSDWDRGPWDDEPDKVQWQDTDTGLPCLIVRGPHGALCGYVGVPPGNALYGQDYYNAPDALHGAAHCGLTYSAACQPSEDESRGICHLPAEGEPDHVWWFGFDCAHCVDLSPKDSKWRRERGFASFGEEVYREIGYVQRKVAELAAAIASQ